MASRVDFNPANPGDGVSKATAITLARYYFTQNEICRIFQGVLSGKAVHICDNTAMSLARCGPIGEQTVLFTIWHTDRPPLRHEMSRAELMQ